MDLPNESALKGVTDSQGNPDPAMFSGRFGRGGEDSSGRIWEEGEVESALFEVETRKPAL